MVNKYGGIRIQVLFMLQLLEEALGQEYSQKLDNAHKDFSEISMKLLKTLLEENPSELKLRLHIFELAAFCEKTEHFFFKNNSNYSPMSEEQVAIFIGEKLDPIGAITIVIAMTRIIIKKLQEDLT